MTEKRLLAVLVVEALVLAVLLGLFWRALPDPVYASEQFKFWGPFGTSLITAMATGVAAWAVQEFRSRPIVRIEHVDVKSERIPFTLDDDLWWQLSHGPLVKALSEEELHQVAAALQKNEFQYFHLRDLEELTRRTLKAFEATSRWTRGLLAIIDTFAQAPSSDLRLQIIEELAGDVVRFDGWYRETNQASLFSDLEENPERAAKFLGSEIAALLAQHDREIKCLERTLSWISESLSAGENPPEEIDHHDSVVPGIRIFVGATNVGRTPALVSFQSSLEHRDKQYPLRPVPGQDRARLAYNFVGPNQTAALQLEVDRNACSFQDQSALYRSLTKGDGDRSFSIVLTLADGQAVTRSYDQLVDNPNVRA